MRRDASQSGVIAMRAYLFGLFFGTAATLLGLAPMVVSAS
jgi:hypothetical protein